MFTHRYPQQARHSTQPVTTALFSSIIFLFDPPRSRTGLPHQPVPPAANPASTLGIFRLPAHPHHAWRAFYAPGYPIQ
ncbi:hypothetical protein [Paraflavitalea pollutisoli]|uniref:hypothetical protein n=1 Tax=Paraflavitalea pollutisoli TaxID=3034143 RepID=UPI0023ED9415|nr:hypothetical protein [Paraflavitalea sp. H1-2-19X]